MAHRDCRGSTGGCAYRPQPVRPIFAPEVAARAILFAATHRRREVWVGFPTVKATWQAGSRQGWSIVIWRGQQDSGQLTSEPASPDAPGTPFGVCRRQLGRRGTLRQPGAASKLADAGDATARQCSGSVARNWLAGGYGAHYGFAGRRSDNARHTESCGLLSRTADCSPCWRCGLH